MSFEYNLFISHSWSYPEQYDSLVQKLDERSYFKYRNHSIPKDNCLCSSTSESQLYQAIKNKVQGTHVVVFIAGVYASYSHWIDREIYIAAKEFSKPILAIEPWGSERTSFKVKVTANLVVKWNTESIVAGIRELY